MKHRNISPLLLFLFLLITAFSCTKDPKVEPIIPKGRTLLVYIAGDGKKGQSNLSGEVEFAQAALMKGWDNQTMGSLVIFADRNNSSPVLIKLTKNKNETVADTLRTYKNENSASPELLQQVIADTRIIAPGESYGMILFSHASGWLPINAYPDILKWEATAEGSRVTPRSIFEDNGREMEFSDFVAAIPDGMFEFIASEMCFMSSVETAYALRNKTKYLLAAAPEVLSPGFEPIYKTSLDLLYKPTPDLKGFAQAFYKYFSELPDEYDRGYDSAAISVVKTSEMGALASLTRRITPMLTQEQIDKVQYYDRNGKPNVFFDYRDYIAQVATDAQMAELDGLLDKAVIFKRSTPKLINIYIPKHSGLSVYIPQEALPGLNEAYKETDWYKATLN